MNDSDASEPGSSSEDAQPGAKVGAPSAVGEVAGSFLLGLVQSFYNLSTLPQGGLDLEVGQIDPQGWYPHALMIDTLHSIEKAIPASESLFFRAGINFLQIWYEHGPGKTMMHSSMDWLHANDEGGGYNTVVRGGSKEEIGWCRVQSINEEAGIAVIENVMPLPVAFLRGVFYGGCLIFDDLDFVSVDGTSVPYEGNSTFNKCLVTVQFRLKPKGAAQDLDDRVQAMKPGDPVVLNAQEIERLAWRYKWVQYQRALDAKYANDVSFVLAQATVESQRISSELARSQAELQASNREITKLSITDGLTQLANRIQLDRVIEENLQLAMRYGTVFSVILLDMDNFKYVNDTYGHLVGDDVLVQVAEILVANTRKVDIVGRWGGEEFLAVLPATKLDGAGQFAENLRAAIDQTEFPVGGRRTGSFGVACFRQDDDPIKLISRADAALYGAKRAGRNCVRLDRGA